MDLVEEARDVFGKYSLVSGCLCVCWLSFVSEEHVSGATLLFLGQVL